MNMNYRLILIVALVALSFSGYSQLSGSVGLKGGYDKQYFIYDDLLYGENYDAFPDFNIGLDAALDLTKNIRVRAELKYSNVSYTREYNTSTSLLENIEYSKMQINNMNINPFVDFRILNVKDKLELYYTLGMKLEFSLGDRQRAFTYDDEKIDASYILEPHKDVMIGSATGLIFKYNINKHWGVTVSPEYTIFFGQFYENSEEFYDNSPKEMNNYYMRSSLNFGLEYTF